MTNDDFLQMKREVAARNRSRRRPWPRWTVSLPLPPADDAGLPAWRTAALAELAIQRPSPIPAMAAVEVTACVSAIAIDSIGSRVIELLRDAGALPQSTEIASLNAGMDRMVPSGTMIVKCHRTTPPASRVPAEVRRRVAERQAAKHAAVRAMEARP